MVSQSMHAAPGAVRTRPAPKTARKLKHIPAEVMRTSIEEFIAANGPSPILAIATKYGYARTTTRKFAKRMCAADKLHFVARQRADGGREHFYDLGPAPEVEIDDTVDHDSPNRPVRTAWKPHHKRHWMDVAFFGPAAAMQGALI